MSRLDRRRFLALSAAAAAATQLPAHSQLRTNAAGLKGFETTLTLHPDKPGPTIPANFIGLSYETQQLTDPAFFSLQNTGLIAQFRALAPHGVLRLGGNTSDVGWWKPTPSSPQPPLPEKVVIIPLHADEQPFQKLAFSVTPEAVRNLRAFLDATGWTCLYGINLGTSTPARAAEEAAYVAKTLGSKLEYFQLGNEPDLFPARFRVKATWTADTYFDEWLASANAIRAVVPGARFAIPDTSGSPQWYATIANRLLAMREGCDRQGGCDCTEKIGDLTTRPRIAALTHHYYFGGPPSNPKVNLNDLLHHSDKADLLAKNITTAAALLNVEHQKPIPYRMSEGNTCYRGGKPGVSDVFGAALWAADYALTLASFGYAGLNLHGGSGRAVADSLGGTLPGELLMPDPKAPHPRPFYTPIAEINGTYTAEPVNYGLRFAQMFAGATMIAIDFDPGPVNATAYAARTADGRTLIAVINKDPDSGLILHTGVVAKKQMHLTGPSLTSTSAEITSDKLGKVPEVSGSMVLCGVAPASALFIEA